MLLVGRIHVDLLRVTTAACPSIEVGNSGIADARHLVYAIEQGVVILTHDHEDFEDLHDLIVASGGTHSGILVVRRDNDSTRDLQIGNSVGADVRPGGDLTEFEESHNGCRHTSVIRWSEMSRGAAHEIRAEARGHGDRQREDRAVAVHDVERDEQRDAEPGGARDAVDFRREVLVGEIDDAADLTAPHAFGIEVGFQRDEIELARLLLQRHARE